MLPLWEWMSGEEKWRLEGKAREGSGTDEDGKDWAQTSRTCCSLSSLGTDCDQADDVAALGGERTTPAMFVGRRGIEVED